MKVPSDSEVLSDSQSAPRPCAACLCYCLSLLVVWSCDVAVYPRALWAPQRKCCIHVTKVMHCQPLPSHPPKNTKSCFQVDSIRNLKLWIIVWALKTKQNAHNNADQTGFVFTSIMAVVTNISTTLILAHSAPTTAISSLLAPVLTMLPQAQDFAYALPFALCFLFCLAKFFLASTGMEATWRPRTSLLLHTFYLPCLTWMQASLLEAYIHWRTNFWGKASDFFFFVMNSHRWS